MKKKWYESWTIWVNAITAAGGVVAQANGVDTGAYSGALLAIVAAVNAVLRLKTNKGVTV